MDIFQKYLPKKIEKKKRKWKHLHLVPTTSMLIISGHRILHCLLEVFPQIMIGDLIGDLSINAMAWTRYVEKYSSFLYPCSLFKWYSECVSSFFVVGGFFGWWFVLVFFPSFSGFDLLHAVWHLRFCISTFGLRTAQNCNK